MWGKGQVSVLPWRWPPSATLKEVKGRPSTAARGPAVAVATSPPGCSEILRSLEKEGGEGRPSFWKKKKKHK